MMEDKQINIFSCLLPDGITEDPLTDSYTQTESYVSPIRVVYVETAEDVKQVEANEEALAGDSEDEQRRRIRHPENWRQNIRKKNKNQGLAYIKANGEFCAEKNMGPPCICKMKCYKRLGEEACKKVFTNFWKLGDYALQNSYIAGCVKIMLPKQYSKRGQGKGKDTSSSPSRRFYTRYFFVNVNGVDTEVCKQAFLNMHCVSNGRLDRLLKKKQESGNTGIDKRGRHNNKVNKIPLEKIREVRRSIDGFRKRAGFTGKRKSVLCELLPAPLNIRTMYKSYKDELIAKGLDPVCEFRYRKIFHNDFHLDFVRPTVASQATTVPPPSNITTIQPIEVTEMETEPVFTLSDKPIYTTLEGSSKDSSTYVTYSQDLYSSSFTLQPQNWVFTSQT